MSIGDGIALASLCLSGSALLCTLAWKSVRISQIRLEAAKNHLVAKTER